MDRCRQGRMPRNYMHVGLIVYRAPEDVAVLVVLDLWNARSPPWNRHGRLFSSKTTCFSVVGDNVGVPDSYTQSRSPDEARNFEIQDGQDFDVLRRPAGIVISHIDFFTIEKNYDSKVFKWSCNVQDSFFVMLSTASYSNPIFKIFIWFQISQKTLSKVLLGIFLWLHLLSFLWAV